MMIDNSDHAITVHCEDRYIILTVQPHEDFDFEEPDTYAFTIDEALEFIQMLNESIKQAKENV